MTPGAAMMLSELNKPFSFTPQSVAKEPREASAAWRGREASGWTLVMGAKSAATGPLPACPPLPPWPLPCPPWSPSPCAWPGCSPVFPSVPSPCAGASLPESRTAQAARVSSPSGRFPTRSMAIAMRSRVAARLSFSGFMMALSAKPASCRTCWADSLSRWYALAICSSSRASSLSTSGLARSGTAVSSVATSGQSIVAPAVRTPVPDRVQAASPPPSVAEA